jgi:hypothetical protein
MSTKKKAVTKTPDPKPKYAIGQRVFYIIEHKGKPEEVIECKVKGQITQRSQQKDFLDRVEGMRVYFAYELETPKGTVGYFTGYPISEILLYPSFTAAAQVFAKSFLTLLK